MSEPRPPASAESGTSAEGPSAVDKICIFPGCQRSAVPPHPLGGPQPAFCDLEEHNALTAHRERQRLANQEEEESG